MTRVSQVAIAQTTQCLAVEAKDLVKRYSGREVNAVDGVSFTVGSGEVFGLLGPNGAGKTTVIGLLTTRVAATSGQALLAGVDLRRDPVAARARLAVVPQQSNLDSLLTPKQNLVFHAAYHGVPRAVRTARAMRLLDELGLAGEADIKVDWYSGGMAQRLMIARALMHEPEVLFLDEPTAGLDPQARLFVWDRIRELRLRGITVVLSTHDMDEAAGLADRVGIIDHGRLLALDTPQALTRALSGHAVLDLTVVPAPGDATEELLSDLLMLDGVKQGERRPQGASVQLRLSVTDEPAALLAPVATTLAARRAALSNVRIGQPSLEDVFLHHTGRALR